MRKAIRRLILLLLLLLAAWKWWIPQHTKDSIRGEVERIHIEDYPAIKQHLDYYWDKIEPRADQGETAYNLRNCAYLDDFSRPK